MANRISQTRTAFHRRFDELTRAVGHRPVPGTDIDQILDVKIGVVISPTPWKCWSLAPGQTLLEAVELMCREKVSLVFVRDKNRFLGLITRTQVLLALEAGMTGEPVEKHMVKSNNFVSLNASDTVGTALDRFETTRFKHLLVTDDKGFPMGLLSAGQLLRWLGQRMRELRSAGTP